MVWNNLMTPKLAVDPVLARIKSNILAVAHEVVEFILFGSAARDGHPRDIDVALIVPDKTDLFAFAQAISPIIASYTAELGILINCFPVQAHRYYGLRSQFLSNIHTHGRKF
jgi:predicted nucleotidyltransferase